ncbi:hypothetical protein [Streptomyces sp. NPDC006668]|uniref:alcohol dehydrogenase catalytic domain-containing protein n=1 Tax=Streptomyces sp. NPDC006668 TaxID=3156903 RepID=UPI00340FBD54
MDHQARAVRFDQYGDRDVLRITELQTPEPGPGQVDVKIRAAGVNPFDAMLRSGVIRDLVPVQFPVGQGRDLAGVVVTARTLRTSPSRRSSWWPSHRR